MKPILAIVALTALSGCSGVSYVMDNYGSIPRVEWRNSEGITFRVFDKPAENRLMITPSIGASAVQGLTWGASREPGLVYEAAANEWLAAQGRSNCRAVRTVNILDPQHEVFYTCS